GDTTPPTHPVVVSPSPATPPPDDSGILALPPKEEASIDKQVVLAQLEDGKEILRYVLGPTSLTGKAVSTASAQFDTTSGQWLTEVEFKGGQQGIDGFNALSIQCYDASTVCPTRQTAIVLDGEVLSAPVPQDRGFSGNTITISGDGTSANEAESLAVQLKYGSLPVEFIPQQVQTVSATLGKDSLRAGVVAGIVGLALVLLFMTFYYRTIGGLVILLGLCISGSLMYSLVSFLGVNQGLALTLSGATGIIVSIGVTVDSYVVYFERLKDDVRSGKTLRSSAERGFAGAYRTIIAADSVSLLGAVVLWYLTVGSVRGFAFFLGLSTLLDMIVAYFFTRPFVIMLSRSGKFMRNNVFGVKLADVATATSGTGSASTRSAVTSVVPPRPRGGAR
ncbi:MAG: preprotein translocase subunit SecD, partial [Acidimicrobiia bacterium]